MGMCLCSSFCLFVYLIIYVKQYALIGIYLGSYKFLFIFIKI